MRALCRAKEKFALACLRQHFENITNLLQTVLKRVHYTASQVCTVYDNTGSHNYIVKVFL